MRFYLPYTGESRKVRKFAWYPMYIGHTVYWLEWLTIKQTYNTRHSGWNIDWVMEED